MSIIEYLKNKRKKEASPITSEKLTELQKQNKETLKDGEISSLITNDYSKTTPTLRLLYVAFEKFAEYGTNKPKIGETYGVSSVFSVPNGMSMDNACKIVSYLSNKVEKENDLEPACEKSVIMVSNILEKYGFSKVDSKGKGHYHAVSEDRPFRNIYDTKITLPICNKIDGVVDLITVGGDFNIFKQTDLFDRYFDWYSENITPQEVTNIYKSIEQEYLEPFNTDSDDEKNLNN